MKTRNTSDFLVWVYFGLVIDEIDLSVFSSASSSCRWP